MVVLICGGRDFFDYQVVEYVMKKLNLPIQKIVNGAAKGADNLATRWAIDNQIDYQEYPADWKLFKKAAGHIRNSQMLQEEEIDLVIAFPGGSGTQDMITKSNQAQIEVLRIKIQILEEQKKVSIHSSFSAEKSILGRS